VYPARLVDAAFPSKDVKGTMYEGVFQPSELWHEAAYEALGGANCYLDLYGFS
jgi:hypothetical protein